MSIRATRIESHGWTNLWRIENGEVELLVTGDVGPRILCFGFTGEENQFYEVEEQRGLKDGDTFNIFGGHRLWVSPETDRTTLPDNDPVQVTRSGDMFQFTARADRSGLQKEMRVEVSAEGAQVSVVHRIYNQAPEPTLAAPWALTVLRPGGRAVVPLPPRAPWGPETLLPTSSLALWPYTDLSLPCWLPGTRYIHLDQRLVHSGGFGMQKIGIGYPGAWGAYWRDRYLFVKQSPAAPRAAGERSHKAQTPGRHPDFGSNVEIYAEARFIEIETLGLEVLLQPGAHVEHREYWMLFREVAEGEDDGWVEREVLPRVAQLGICFSNNPAGPAQF